MLEKGNNFLFFKISNKACFCSSKVVSKLNLSLLFIILSGFLQALSWIYLSFMPLIFISLIPIIIFSFGRELKTAFFAGWLYGIIFHTISLYWLADVLSGYGGLGFLLAWTAIFLLSAFLALFSALFVFLIAKYQFKNLILWVFFGAAIYCGLDWIKNWIFTGFNWTPLAAPISVSPLLLQFADLFGIYGLGFFVALINFCLAVIIIKFIKKDKKSPVIKKNICIIFTVVCFWLIYSSFTLNKWLEVYEEAKYETVAVLQPSIPQDEKWDANIRNNTLHKYEALALEAAAENPSLIIWPESAMPFIFGYDSYETFWLYELARNVKTPMLIGIPAFKQKENGEMELFSRAMLMEDSISLAYYDKQHLVPFGEYLPLKNSFSVFEWLFSQGIIGASGNYSKGTTPGPIKFGNFNLGVLICYESIFPYMAKKRVKEGADIFIVTTNDGWFGESVAPRQHLYQAVMRAVEMRRPVIRAGNNGISAEITAYGHIVNKSNLNDVAVFYYKMPTNLKYPNTIYYIYTYYFPHLCALLVSLLLFFALFRRKKKGN